MYLIIKETPMMNMLKVRKLAVFIEDGLSMLQGRKFSVDIRSDTIDEALEMMEEWELTPEQLKELEG